MSQPITASMLYDLVQCPHRVTMDLFGASDKRDPVSAFVKLLWERGHAYEEQVIAGLDIPFTNLRAYSQEERERLTMEAIGRGDTLIYGGRISAGDLLGEPDLLRRQDDGYMAGDIKSGAGEERGSHDTDGKPKKHYAVQLAFYTDILERLGLSAGRFPFVWDVHGQEVIYDLDAPQGARTPTSLWDYYQSCFATVRGIVARREQSCPALGGTCKFCYWRTVCKKQLVASQDLSLIPELGRSRRDTMSSHLNNVAALAEVQLSSLALGSKTVFPGIGRRTLVKFQARARLQMQARPQAYLKEPVDLPHTDRELFFDIETDPMRDICYLHGFAERWHGDNSTERYVPFLAESPTPQEEERAFAEAWTYVQASQPCTVYYYSPYERTFWRKLQQRYPNVATAAQIEAMFSAGAAVDLYNDVVRPKTEWPTYDYSIKTLALHLGFRWRDSDPSGASSIEWYSHWVDTGDSAVRQRILDYNEDDCTATRVLLDGIRRLPVL